MRHPVEPGFRRLIAFICVVALLVTALTPAVSAAHHAVLVPVDPLFGLVVIGEPLPIPQPASYQAPLLEVTGSRPPPIL